MYTQKLGVGPFPTNDCAVARITGELHGELVIYLANIAGIASHGANLATLEAPRKLEFRRLVARSFSERFPQAKQKITPEKAPMLFRLMADTDEARLLIKEYFDS